MPTWKAPLASRLVNDFESLKSNQLICFIKSAGRFFSESAKVGFAIVLLGSPSRKPVGVASRRTRRERLGWVTSVFAVGCSALDAGLVAAGWAGAAGVSGFSELAWSACPSLVAGSSFWLDDSAADDSDAAGALAWSDEAELAGVASAAWSRLAAWTAGWWLVSDATSWSKLVVVTLSWLSAWTAGPLAK